MILSCAPNIWSNAIEFKSVDKFIGELPSMQSLSMDASDMQKKKKTTTTALSANIWQPKQTAILWVIRFCFWLCCLSEVGSCIRSAMSDLKWMSVWMCVKWLRKCQYERIIFRWPLHIKQWIVWQCAKKEKHSSKNNNSNTKKESSQQHFTNTKTQRHNAFNEWSH